MNNEKVIKRFLEKRAGKTPTREIQNGCYTYKGETLKTNGLELINYSTRIAFHQDNKLYINIGHYSRTTSKIQTLLKRLAEEKNFVIIEYKEEN